MKYNSILSVTTLTVLLTASSLVQAQPGPDRPEGRGSGQQFPQRGMQPGGPGGAPMERLLTEDQRESLRDAMQAQREKMRGLQEQIREARRAMVQAALGDDFNESVVRAKALEVAKLEAEISVLRFKAISEVQPPLSKEQLERFLNPELPQGVAPGVDEERPMNRRATRFRGPAPGDDEMPPRRRPVDE